LWGKDVEQVNFGHLVEHTVGFGIDGRDVDIEEPCHAARWCVLPAILRDADRLLRIGSHTRSYLPYKHTMISEYMPSHHRSYAEWNPARKLRMASNIGPATFALFEAIMKARAHPKQRFHACLGIHALLGKYGPGRIEASGHHRESSANCCAGTTTPAANPFARSQGTRGR
jgi:hypothetical protein